MSLFVFFDTNSLRKKDLVIDDKLNLIIEHAREYSVQLAISRVVYLELVNQGERELKYVRKFYDEYKRVFKYQVFNSSEPEPMLDFSGEERILNPLLENGFIVVDNVHEDIYFAVEAVYKGLKPAKLQGDVSILGTGVKTKEYDLNPYDTNYVDFKFKDNSMKDVFIWRCMIPILQEDNEKHIAFITCNTSDFCDPKDSRRIHPQLHHDLPNDADKRIIVFKDMEDFYKFHIEFVEEFDIQFLEIVRYINLSDIIYTLTDIFDDFEASEIKYYKVIEVKAVCQFRALIGIVFKPTSDLYYSLDEYRELYLLVDVARDYDSMERQYSIDYLSGIDQEIAVYHGWTWPMREDELLEKLLELNLGRAAGKVRRALGRLGREET